MSGMPPPSIPSPPEDNLHDELIDWEHALADAETRASDAQAKVESLYEASMAAEKTHEADKVRLKSFIEAEKQKVADLTTKLNTLVQQTNILISSSEIAQSKGAFTLNEAATIYGAIASMKSALQDHKT